MTTEITATVIRTEHHEFTVGTAWNDPTGPYYIYFRPLNVKTGRPWQASHRVIDGADVQPKGYFQPVAYSTWQLAIEARDRHITKMAKHAR